MAQASYSKANRAKVSLADSLEKYLKSAEEKKTEINSTIDALIEIANTRRKTLLLEIDNEVALVQEEVKNKQNDLSEIEKTELDIHRNLSGNQTRQAMTRELHNQIDKINLNLPNFKLKWSNGTTRMINNFDLICQLLIYTESPFESENNNSPLWISDLKCGNGTNEITEAKSLAIDSATQNIYVGDASGKKILIFNKLGDYVETLAIKTGPSSIGRMIIHCGFIYCYINSIISTKLFKLDKSTGVRIAEIDTGSVLSGLTICNNIVHTCSKNAQLIFRFSTYLVTFGKLEIKSPFIKRGRLWHSEVQDMVSISDKLVMLLSYAERPIQAFDLSGGLLWGINLENYSVLGEQYLCIDKQWNIIIASNQDKFLRVYNKDGNSIGKVGKVGEERGDMYYPRGIALDFGGNLIVCDCKKKFLLQAY